MSEFKTRTRITLRGHLPFHVGDFDELRFAGETGPGVRVDTHYDKKTKTTEVFIIPLKHGSLDHDGYCEHYIDINVPLFCRNREDNERYAMMTGSELTEHIIMPAKRNTLRAVVAIASDLFTKRAIKKLGENKEADWTVPFYRINLMKNQAETVKDPHRATSASMTSLLVGIHLGALAYIDDAPANEVGMAYLDRLNEALDRELEPQCSKNYEDKDCVGESIRQAMTTANTRTHVCVPGLHFRQDVDIADIRPYFNAYCTDEEQRISPKTHTDALHRCSENYTEVFVMPITHCGEIGEDGRITHKIEIHVPIYACDKKEPDKLSLMKASTIMKALVKPALGDMLKVGVTANISPEGHEVDWSKPVYNIYISAKDKDDAKLYADEYASQISELMRFIYLKAMDLINHMSSDMPGMAHLDHVNELLKKRLSNEAMPTPKDAGKMRATERMHVLPINKPFLALVSKLYKSGGILLQDPETGVNLILPTSEITKHKLDPKVGKQMVVCKCGEGRNGNPGMARILDTEI